MGGKSYRLGKQGWYRRLPMPLRFIVYVTQPIWFLGGVVCVVLFIIGAGVVYFFNEIVNPSKND